MFFFPAGLQQFFHLSVVFVRLNWNFICLLVIAHVTKRIHFLCPTRCEKAQCAKCQHSVNSQKSLPALAQQQWTSSFVWSNFFWEIQLIIVLGSTGVTFWQDQLFQGCCWNLLCCDPSRQSQNSESAEKFWLFFIWNSDSVWTFWLFLIKNSESSGTFSLFLIRNSSGICCVVIKGGGANILNLNFRSAFWIITWCGSIKYQNLPFSSGWRNRFSSEYTET